MKALVYRWHGYGHEDLIAGLEQVGIETQVISYAFTEYEYEPEFCQIMKNTIRETSFDFVISLNYFQGVARVCQQVGLPYLAWTVDCPLLNAFSDTIRYDTNYIFSFDKQMSEEFLRLGAQHVCSLPLAVNGERLGKMKTASHEEGRYASEISFVGRTYEKTNFYDEAVNLSPHLKGYFDGVMDAQVKVYGYNFLEQMITKEIAQELFAQITLEQKKEFLGTREMVFANMFLGTKTSSIERIRLLNRLCETFPVTIFTDSNTDLIKGIVNKGPVDYLKEMPKVFANSKINLNITMRNIKSGIPLRCFDVLGCGGFLLSNYQEELFDWFQDGVDLATYGSEEELVDKAAFYLAHDEERMRISRAGYENVRENHSFVTRIQTMLDVVFHGA